MSATREWHARGGAPSLARHSRFALALCLPLFMQKITSVLQATTFKVVIIDNFALRNAVSS